MAEEKGTQPLDEKRDVWERVGYANTILHMAVMDLEKEFEDLYLRPEAKREVIRKAYEDIESKVEDIKFLHWLMKSILKPEGKSDG